MLLEIVLLQLPLSKFVIVIVEFPEVVNPVAVKLPVPAVVTTIVAVSPVAAGELRSYVTVYVPTGSLEVVEFVKVTVEVPSQGAVAVVLVKLYVVTAIVFVLLLLIVFEQLPIAKPVIVIVEFPAFLKPVAVNVPVPAEVTSIDAVKPVAAGALLL